MNLIKTFAEAVRQQEGCRYLMLDEITAVKDWTRAVKSLVDAGALEDIYCGVYEFVWIEKYGYQRKAGQPVNSIR